MVPPDARRGGLIVRSFDQVKPDPDKVGGVAEAPFVRLPDPATIFADRAKRLRDLAADNPLGPYMRFLGDIVAAQHAIGAGLPPPSPQQAPLAQQPEFTTILDAMLDATSGVQAPQQARAAHDRLVALNQSARRKLAEEISAGTYETDRIGESLYVAASVQLYLVRQSACLDAKTLQPRPDNTCPCCGAAPVSSMIVGWTQAHKARYLCCSLCSTLWNFVRIKCVSCSSTDGIVYSTIDGGPRDVAVETCSVCRTYIKHLHQHQAPLLEPFADDVASYGLDLLVRQEGFRSSALNPLLVGA
jgi:FdhE protein